MSIEIKPRELDIYAKYLMSWRGFIFGILFSLVLGYVISTAILGGVLSTFNNFFEQTQSEISEQESTQNERDEQISTILFSIENTKSIALTTGFLLSFLTFIFGLRLTNSEDAVKPTERGLMLFLGSRINSEVPEGIYWMLPRPIMRTLQPPFDMQKKALNLCFAKGSVTSIDKDGNTIDMGGKPIVLGDGSLLKRADLTILYQLKPGYLYDVSQIGDIDIYLKELAEDRIRNGALLLTKYFKNSYLRSVFRDIGAVALIASLSQWERLIIDGGIDSKYKPNGKTAEEINDEDLVINHTLPSIDSKKDDAEGTIDKFNKSERDKLRQIVGLRESAALVGIDIIEVTISSAELPDQIQDKIDAQLTEQTEQMQFTRDVETLNLVINALLDESKGDDGKPTISFEKALNSALVTQEKPNTSLIEISGGSDATRIAAGLFSKGISD